MRTVCLATLAVLLFTIALPAQTGALPTGLEQGLDRLVERGLSGNLLVVSGEKVLLHRAMGYRARETELPTTRDTLYYAGSLAKQFTAAAVLQLQEQGLLKLSDTLPTWFAGVPGDKAGITVHHLLSHTSGLPGMYGEYFEVVDVRANVKAILQQKLLSEPGEAYSYSNSGYNLLAALVARISGQDFLSYLQKHLFEPAGIPGALTVYDLPRIRTNLIAHASTAGSPAAWQPTAKRLGAGGLVLAVDHLWRWQQALLSGEIVSPQSLRLMVHPNKNNYGYGLFVRNDSGALRWYHSGSLGGFYSFFYTRGDTDFGVFLLTNQQPPDFDDAFHNFLRKLEAYFLSPD